MKITSKADPFSPAFEIETGGIAIKSGVVFDCGDQTNPFVILPETLAPGVDYSIHPNEHGELTASTARIPGEVGGFHVGLDGKPVAASIWDALFRPKCADPRGMVLVAGQFWADIYLATESGESKAGATLARNITWWDAVSLLAALGKQLLSASEFFLAADGATEGKTCGERPETTAHVEGLRSKVGLEQATGTLWTWTRDLESGRYALVMGGSWGTSVAGPRQLGPGYASGSYGSVGARGRCDHLILA